MGEADEKARNRQRLSRLALRRAGFVVIAALLVVLAGVTGNGPLSSLQRSAKASSSASGSDSAGSDAGGTTSSTALELQQGEYSKGDCVTWDQTPIGGPQQTTVVPCNTPHLIEMSARVDVTGRFDHYPTDAEWLVFANRDCLTSAQSLLGAPLDPSGKYTTGFIRPARDGWEQGQRSVWCGVELAKDHPTARPGDAVPFRGKVEGSAQAYLRAVGRCFTTTSPFAVPCSKSHLVEITGYVDLSDDKTKPPPVSDNRAWNALVGSKCANVGRVYLGHEPTGNEGTGWEPILPASWDAGRRTVECTVGRYDKNGTALLSSGSLKG